jgi:hypothetical protein
MKHILHANVPTKYLTDICTSPDSRLNIINGQLTEFIPLKYERYSESNPRLFCGICGGQSGAGAGFHQVLRFPLPIFIPPISPQSPSPIIRGWYNRPVVAAVPKVPPN